jgi:hypothetical protein
VNTATLSIERILNQIAEELEIPQELADAAKEEYAKLAHWLDEQDKAQGRREPKVYSQGSFRLGTTIRPIEGDYDVDLVYERDLRKESITREELKEQAGELLASYVAYLSEAGEKTPQLADEGRRCWTLDYPGEFHMDVLPAIPDDDGRKSNGSPHGILITDRNHDRWRFSDPIGYGEWFKNQSHEEFQRRREELARRRLLAEGLHPTEGMIKASAEQIPEYEVKTPLQRAVQILKRHRDVQFKADEDNRPASIILTTLAARAYKNEPNLLDALLNLVRGMPNYIEERVENGKVVSWVPNPVNDNENFADRWQDEEHPDREQEFKRWLRQVDDDLTEAIRSGSIHRIVDILGGSLGTSVVHESARKLGWQVNSIKAADASLTLGDASHREAPKWPLVSTHKVKVTGGVYKEMYGSKKLWNLSRRPVTKGLCLRFFAETNVPAPYDVYWQVVNTGEEARRKDQLRGQFEEGNSSLPNVRWEGTEYTGTHWIEAFVVKDGVCRARSGPVYVRIRG